MTPLAPEVALAFYDCLGRDGELAGILHAVPGRVERLYRTFAQWYGELFSGVYDRAYAEKRRVGLVHARLGVAPRPWSLPWASSRSFPWSTCARPQGPRGLQRRGGL